MKDKIDNSELPSHNIGYIPSTRFLELVQWKIKNRTHESDNLLYVTINTSIIIDCTIYIEGFINLFLIEYFNIYRSGDSEKKITDYFIKKIESSEFKTIQEFFTLFTNLKLSNITNDKTFNGVTHLFKLRNSIVHGNEIHIQFFRKEEKYEVKATGKYADVFEYLKQVGVFPKTLNETVDFDHFFSNEMTDFFIKITEDFSKDFRNNTMDYNLDLLNQYFEHYF